MRLLIIRHGDPDYSIDSLTPEGWKEAELLSERLMKTKIDHYYVSPLGRAKDTASLTLKKKGEEAIECDWLQEFPPRIWRPDVTEKKMIPWDWLPEDWTKDPKHYDYEEWCKTDIMKEGEVEKTFSYVTEKFDELLAKHGYVREGNLYRVEKANTETIAIFCHFGLECVLLGHLLGISVMSLWHGTVFAPSSVTTIHTEERRKGIASFRAASLGDISHLYAGGVEPAFAARFCEVWDSEDRHD
ncbi:MAG: histidine phosphatase family protein [Dorea sp.]|nr:histidine phosphatase family protein [Dorea sp.]